MLRRPCFMLVATCNMLLTRTAGYCRFKGSSEGAPQYARLLLRETGPTRGMMPLPLLFKHIMYLEKLDFNLTFLVVLQDCLIWLLICCRLHCLALLKLWHRGMSQVEFVALNMAAGTSPCTLKGSEVSLNNQAWGAAQAVTAYEHCKGCKTLTGLLHVPLGVKMPIPLYISPAASAQQRLGRLLPMDQSKLLVQDE